MKRAIVLIGFLACLTGVRYAGAQGVSTVTPPPSCGTIWIPCGTLPFPTLNLPSPTIRPTLPKPTAIALTITASPVGDITPTAGPSPTLTPSPTETLMIDTGPVSTIAGNIGGFAATLQNQPTFSMIVGGTAIGRDDAAVTIGSNIGQLFGVARGMELTDLNKAGGIISFFLLSIGFALTVQLSLMFLPILWKLLQLVTHIIAAVVDMF